MRWPAVSARRTTAWWWYFATTAFCSDWNAPPAVTVAGAGAAEPADRLPSGTSSTVQQNTTAPQPESSPAAVRRIPYNPDLYVPENTAIPCSLDYRFVSDRAGKIRCTIAEDICSASGNTKLIEKETTASGVYQTGAETGMTHGEGRAFLIITKLRTRQHPYLDIPLVDSKRII